jgi:sulfatase maturation enzyme AslB (radical SAM superfamily)
LNKSCRDHELTQTDRNIRGKGGFRKNDELLKNGVLKLNKEKKEVEPDKRLGDPATLKIINSMVILISEDCNLACKYCYVKTNQYQGKSDLMDPDVGKKSIDFLIEDQKIKKICLSISLEENH